LAVLVHLARTRKW